MRDLIDRILKRDPRAIARAITAVENKTTDATPILKALFPNTGRAMVLGITGAPGSGKSTLVDRLIERYRSANQTVAVVAVDPTSPFTGGAILGDRVRMQSHSLDPGTYIRSMATRGHLGGLSQATRDVVSILDAAGFDVVIVETVGVGQGEVDIAKTADVTVVVLVPGMGDDVQTMKAGLMEIADLFVINKSDREGVLHMEQELHVLLSLTTRADEWQPPIVKTIATQNIGIDELREKIRSYQDHLAGSPQKNGKRITITRQTLLELLQERLLNTVVERVLSNGALNQYIEQIVAKEKDPYTVVDEILKRVRF